MPQQKPAQRIVPLHNLMYKGYNGGLRWETFGSLEWDEESGIAHHNHSFLLHHNHSFHISKCIIKGLNTTDKTKISEAFAEIYELATENVELCKNMSPMEFFARAKNTWEWSAKISEEAFWAFTYKAFHARAIFLKYYSLESTDKREEGFEEKDIPNGQPLMHALDDFRAAFDETYIENYIPEPKKNPHPEEIDEENGIMAMFKKTREAYFPYELTAAGGEGDGLDKRVQTRDVRKPSDGYIHDYQNGAQRDVKAEIEANIQGPGRENNAWMHMDMDAEEEEERIGFYFDLGPEKTGANKNAETNNNGDEEEDDKEDDDGDVEMMDVEEAEDRKAAETVARLRALALK
ncbi:hypothetical protein F4809DRAFT_656151 [Biscogniauxia mediterranea]|nr:hypothetical protein F4809DRAFT_656151 [Biscogniauxia mediterranea]